MFSRRHFIKIAAAGLALSQTLEAKINSRINGVYVGIQTYTLRGLRYDAVIPAMKQVGIGECELWSTQVEPTAAWMFRTWRNGARLFLWIISRAVRKKFNQAGIEIYAYNPRFGAAGGRGGRGARGAGAAAGQNPSGAAALPATPPPALRHSATRNHRRRNRSSFL